MNECVLNYFHHIIGNAKLAGLTKSITISDSDYNWALSIFFIGYVSAN